MAFSGLSNWFKKRIDQARDVVDANTASDQYKRMVAGQPRYYQDQLRQRASSSYLAPTQQPPARFGVLASNPNALSDSVNKTPVFSVGDILGPIKDATMQTASSIVKPFVETAKLPYQQVQLGQAIVSGDPAKIEQRRRAQTKSFSESIPGFVPKAAARIGGSLVPGADTRTVKFGGQSKEASNANELLGGGVQTYQKGYKDARQAGENPVVAGGTQVVNAAGDVLALVGAAKSAKEVVKPTAETLKLANQNAASLNEVGAVGKNVSQPEQPQGFIAKETKPRNGIKDTVRVSKDPVTGQMRSTIQTEPATAPVKDPYIKEYADMLKDQESGLRGGQLVNTADGKARITDHTPFYRQFFKENGRKPTSTDWYNEAARQVKEGKADPAFMDYYSQVNKNRLSADQRVLDNKPGRRMNDSEVLSLQQTPEGRTVAPSNKYSTKRGKQVLDPVVDAKAQQVLSAGGSRDQVAKVYMDAGADYGVALKNADRIGGWTTPTEVKTSPVLPAEPKVIVGKVKKDPTVKQALEDISRSRGVAQVDANLIAAQIANKGRELGVNLGMDFVNKYQTGALATPQEKALGAFIKQIDDQIFAKQRELNPSIEYRRNHIPQEYANKPEDITAAINRLQRDTGAANRRAFNTYSEARAYGLEPKFKTVDQMIGSNISKVQNVAKNRELVNKGLEGGIFTTETKGSPIIGIFDQNGNQIYAQKGVADVLNGVLQKDSTGLAKGVDKLAKLFGASQDIMLQGGVPGTNANFFVTGQMVKDTTRNIGKAPLHPIEAAQQEGHLISDFFRGKDKTQARFADGSFKANGVEVKNADLTREMAKRGVYINPQTSMADSGRNAATRAWHTLGNNPTFGRYMPNRMLSMAQEVYKQSVKDIGHEAALDQAAKTIKTYNGLVDTVAKGRNNLTNDAMSVGLFAPKYRESIINSLVNTVKSVYPTTWSDPAFKPSRQLLAGMMETLVAYELLNRKLTGHSMLDNRKYQELSLEIPYGGKDEKGNQKVINIPFMPGFMTIPRALVGVGQGLAPIAKGKTPDIQQITSQASKALSAPLQTAGNIIANKDYFGRPIYMDQKVAAEQGVAPDNILQASKNIGIYGLGQSLPGWFRAGFDYSKNKSPLQAAATALEAPLRFGKRNPPVEQYYADVNDVRGALNKNDQAVWDSIHPPVRKNAKGEYITGKSVWDGAARATGYLKSPGVLAAENEMARRAASRGEKVDPLFDGSLTPQQQQIALTMDTLPPKDPNKTVLRKQNPWYEDLSKRRSQFFDSLPPADPNKPKAPIAYPEPDAKVASLQDAYYQLKDSGMKRQMLEDNPELADQFAKEEQYSRAVRAAKNLPQYDQYPEPTPQVKKLIDEYMALPKGEANGKSKIRSTWIKNHPTEWAMMSDQFSKQSLYNLQQDAQIAAFEGQDLTDKGIKAIKSLARDLGGSGGNSYSGYGYARRGGRGSKVKITSTADALPPNYVKNLKVKSYRAPASKLRVVQPKRSGGAKIKMAAKAKTIKKS